MDAIRHNYQVIDRSLAPGARAMAIVKADAYGHGAGYVARALQEAGAAWFGVSNLDEAMQIRNAGIVEPILVLAYTPPEEAARLSAFSVSQTVLTREYAAALSAEAARSGVQVRIHVKLDTGMSRVGLLYQGRPEQDERTLEEIAALVSLPGLVPEGIFTHFASADEEDDGGFTRRQFALFTQALERLEAKGVRFPLRHCCNSAATALFPEMHMDLVRPGLILYGLAPAPWLRDRLPLRPAMALKTVVSMVKEVPADTPVSYNRTYTTAGTARLATVPIGYADGYARSLSNAASMLVDGRRAPVVGRVCMDQCMLDVTAIPSAREGMVVTVFGAEYGAVLPVEELAAQSGTVNYETICLIGKRVPRIFLSGGQTVGRLNYIVPER